MQRIEWLNRQPNRMRDYRHRSFKTVFLTVAIGASLCAVLASAIAICLPATTPNEQKVFDALLSSFTLGVGAILGLLGGRSVW